MTMRTKLHAIAFVALISSVLVLGACNNDRGDKRPDKAGTKPGDTDDMSTRNFSGDKKLAVQGREMFLTYNCYGCHGGLAGGAMGPSLRDTTWKYGGSDSLIYHSIHDGRPMGMPSWAGRLNDRQIGALIQYIRSLRTNAEPKFFFASGGDTTAAPAANAAPPVHNSPVPMATKKPSTSGKPPSP
jgi:Cytochrome C oxidase, cbb3-type, subunit III